MSDLSVRDMLYRLSTVTRDKVIAKRIGTHAKRVQRLRSGEYRRIDGPEIDALRDFYRRVQEAGLL